MIATIEFAGLELRLHASGALFIPQYQALLLADMHLEKASHFAMRGQALPPYDTRATLSLLEACIQEFKPERVMTLGDSFHDKHAELRLHEDDAAHLQSLTKQAHFFWITGNHDEILPQNLRGDIINHMALGPLELTHIPTPANGKAQIAGHLHPIAKVQQKARIIRARCFAFSKDRLILPAFGVFTGGLNVRDRAFGQIFPDQFHVQMIGQKALYGFRADQLKP